MKECAAESPERAITLACDLAFAKVVREMHNDTLLALLQVPSGNVAQNEHLFGR